MISRRKLIQGLLTFATATILPRVPAIARPSRASNVIRISGRVKWFDVMRGYGFVIPDNGLLDILLYLSSLKRGGFDVPTEGTRVTFEAVARKNGHQCMRILSSETQS
jgi:cold shock CspA family protein